MVDGYGMHLEARKDIARQGDGDGRISPMWTDLTMWAVLAGQHELAIELWSKVRVRLGLGIELELGIGLGLALGRLTLILTLA